MSRAIAFTCYESPKENVLRWTKSHPSCRALVCQVELCPKTGTPHIQGFIRFNRTVRYPTVFSTLGITYAKCEPAHGTDQDNIIYCTRRDKPHDPTVEPLMFGDFAHQGKRTDLKTVYLEGLNGTLDFNEDNLTVVARYPRFFERCKSLFKPPSYREVKVYYIYGPTNTGKTRSAYDFDPDLYRLFSLKPEWWDGYDSEKTVLIDDFRGDMDTSRLLQILDCYPIRVPIKGSSAWLFATTIFITSNYPPDHFWAGVNLEAILRRITFITATTADKTARTECKSATADFDACCT